MLRETRVVIGQGPAEDYAYRIVRLASRGVERIIVTATGDAICRLADAIALLPELFPGSVRIVSWSVGSRRVKGERKSVLTLEIVLEPPA